MKRKRISYIGIILIITVCFLGVVSCGESDCSITRRPASRFVFKDTNTGVDVTIFDSLNVSAILNKEENDTISLFNRLRAIQYISLPLSYTADTTIFLLDYLDEGFNGYSDTIWIVHTNIPTFISMDCGRDMFFHIEDFDYTRNVLDSISLTNPDIRDHEKENFQIFYTTTAAEE